MSDASNLAGSAKMCIRNVRVPRSLVANVAQFGGAEAGQYLQGDLVSTADDLRLTPATDPAKLARLVLPRLVEPHVHLDKCHSVDRMPDVGGDLRAAIDAQSADKALWTEADLRHRASCGLQELIAAGCKSVRSHVDWPHGIDARTPPLAWHVLKELAQEHRDTIELQLAPLVTLADLEDAQTAQILGKEIAAVDGALGSFVLDHMDRAAGIARAFEVAMRHNIALDFHVDEGLADGLDGLGIIAHTAIETGCEAPVLCGHACSLMNQTGADLDRTLERVARSGLSVVTMPTTNLYLQGRVEGTPDRRGLTRVRELRRAGVPVVVGSDNVRDAFCPLGQHDPRASLSLAVLAAHLDPPLDTLWPMITTDAARALGKTPTYVDQARLEDLLICNAPSSTAALAREVRLRPLTDDLPRSHS